MPTLKEQQVQAFTNARGMYEGRYAVLLTQHGKEAIIGSVLQAAIGCRVVRVDSFDTDQLGTFTRDIPRLGSQLETARRKARISMNLTSSPLGLASEGAFVPDPYTGFLPWNIELVVFIDDDKGLEVVGFGRGPARSGHRAVGSWEELKSFAEEANFPSHHLVVRPNDEHDARICKGISDWAALEEAYEYAAKLAGNGVVFVENDLRAYCNPTRQEIIRAAADNLAKKLQSSCPHCGGPGYWITSTVAGLPCRMCASSTREPAANIWSCGHCKHSEEKRRLDATHADPSRCDWCNP